MHIRFTLAKNREKNHFNRETNVHTRNTRLSQSLQVVHIHVSSKLESRSKSMHMKWYHSLHRSQHTILSPLSGRRHTQ